MLDAQFERIHAEWLALASGAEQGGVEGWQREVEDLILERRDLEARGRWMSGPSDLMSVVGRAGDELTHSAVLAWLIQPAATHGFGIGVLTRLADTLWPDERLPEGPFVVEREVVDRVAAGTRADVLIWIGSDALVVIENKVFASESLDQAERLYQAWAGTRADVRFVLLSRTGAVPVSVRSADARLAWRGLSYRTLARTVEDLLESPAGDELARSTVRQYLATIRRRLM